MGNLNTNTSLAPRENLNLTQAWDKVFSKSDKADHRKVTAVLRKYHSTRSRLSSTAG